MNVAFMDVLCVQARLGFGGDYHALLQYLPLHVDGLLLFEDDFGADDSFRFVQLLPDTLLADLN